MDKIKVLMIDDNVNLTEMVSTYFKKNNKIEIVDCCYNGEEGIKYLTELGNNWYSVTAQFRPGELTDWYYLVWVEQ